MHPPPATDARLSWLTLAGYGAFAMPLAALNLPLYVYLPTYYTTGLGLDLAIVGNVLLLARLFDMVTDPLLGEAADRIATPFGRRRPWLILAAPVLLYASWQLFVPPAGAGALHLLVWSIVAYVAWTLTILAYKAWGAELSNDYDERSVVAGVREAFIIVGILTAAGLPVAFGVEPSSGDALRLVFEAMLLLVPLTLLLLLLLVREREPGPQAHLSLRAGLAVVAENRPFLRLVLAFFLNGIANALPATLFLLFVQHVLGPGADSGLLLLAYFLSAMLSVPFWLKLSYRFGKHRTWAISMLWVCLVFAAVPFLGDGDVKVFAAVCVLSGIGLGADLVLPDSMQADVVDYDHARSGRRRTAFLFALWSMASKLALALAVGVAFPILGWAGFKTDAANTPGSLAVLAGLYAGLPILLKLLSILLIWRFEIDAASQRRLRQQIEIAEGTV